VGGGGGEGEGPPAGAVMTSPAAVAAVFVSGPVDAHRATVASLRRAHPDLVVLVGGPRPEELDALVADGVNVVPAASLGALVAMACRGGGVHVLAVSAPTLFAPAALAPSLDLLGETLSMASVSFLSNAAGFCSFPHLGQPVAHQPEGFDEAAVTARLRETGPPLLAVPIPFAPGPATLLSSYALSAVGEPIDDPALAPEAAIADFSLRARRRGFVNVLDPSTYCARAFDGAGGGPSVIDPAAMTHPWLLDRHPFLAAAEVEEASTETPLGIAHATARAKLGGLRVLVDGSCLGERQMGTQVQAVAFIEALAANPEVARVSVALANDVPLYAASVLRLPKVHARRAALDDGSVFGPVDVVHRPFQPDGALDVDSWRRVGRRTVLTVLDLISYRGAAYHASSEVWVSYRRALRAAMARVDLVVTTTLDVATQIRLERLPVEPDRLVTADGGTDHLGGDEAATIPPLLLDRGFAAGEFVLVIGANYAHKNRDIAIAVHDILRRQGHDLSLVAAGAGVPFGSSRSSEAAAGDKAEVFTLPDLRAEERNWLLRHASLVLYPTSAEGFGLVPSEAARFGTPTVFVPVGPLGEIYGLLPALATDWNPTTVAAVASRLLVDPALASAQVQAVLAASAAYTWASNATKHAAAYRFVLSLPARTERPDLHG